MRTNHLPPPLPHDSPNMAPEWLKTGDFSHLPPLRYYALTFGQYFQCIGYDSTLAVAQSALVFSFPEREITATDLITDNMRHRIKYRERGMRPDAGC